MAYLVREYQPAYCNGQWSCIVARDDHSWRSLIPLGLINKQGTKGFVEQQGKGSRGEAFLIKRHRKEECTLIVED